MFSHYLFLVFLLASFLAPASSLPTLWLVSDSTCAYFNPRGSPIQGFGNFLPDYFTLNVVNRARSGRSARSFINQGLWAELMGLINPNDTVVIEMGHNDAGTPGAGDDVGRDRADLRGIGSESVQVKDRNNQVETVYTFGEYLRRMVADVRSHGAEPVLSGMVPSMIWSADNTTLRTNWPYSRYSEQVAKQVSAGWVDHTHYSVERFQALGKEKSGTMFPQDHTHTNAAGAKLNAEAFVTGVKCGETPAVVKLKEYLSDAGKAVQWDC